LALDGAFHGANKRGYKFENIIDFVNDNWSREIKVFVL
jgi:hypothetical protein